MYNDDDYYCELIRIETKSKISIKYNFEEELNSKKINLVENRLKIKINANKAGLEGDFTLDELNSIPNISEIIKPFEICKKSIFLPTFRRIEGGFNVENLNDLKDGLGLVSESLSKESHLFITSVSTNDIESLINKRYAEISYENNQKETILLEEIINKNTYNNTEHNYKKFIEKFRNVNDENFRSFESFNTAVAKLLNGKHIKIGKISIGNADNIETVNISSLSSGEKQLLGILCYNFFYENTLIFIDEPELSLHVDWQRIMFKIILNQNVNNNQFIISTHSPFIYSRFPDKEFILDEDRGE